MEREFADTGEVSKHRQTLGAILTGVHWVTVVLDDVTMSARPSGRTLACEVVVAVDAHRVVRARVAGAVVDVCLKS